MCWTFCPYLIYTFSYTFTSSLAQQVAKEPYQINVLPYRVTLPISCSLVPPSGRRSPGARNGVKTEERMRRGDEGKRVRKRREANETDGKIKKKSKKRDERDRERWL